MNNITQLLQEEYIKACYTATDIHRHLPTLKQYADKCISVCEMGVRSGQSTRAFLASNVRLTSYDLVKSEEVENLFVLAKQIGKEVKYIEGDVLSVDIEPVDMLFIDTLHIGDQLALELKLHHSKVQKYIAFHDTFTYGCFGEIPTKVGLLPAIIDFVIENPQWRFVYHTIENNGLTVISRD